MQKTNLVACETFWIVVLGSLSVVLANENEDDPESSLPRIHLIRPIDNSFSEVPLYVEYLVTGIFINHISPSLSFRISNQFDIVSPPFAGLSGSVYDEAVMITINDQEVTKGPAAGGSALPISSVADSKIYSPLYKPSMPSYS